MDASGWCSDTDNATPVTVCKGAAIAEPTTVIMSGTVLSYPDDTARQEITSAAVEVIMDAIKSGDLYDQPPEITAAPYSKEDFNTLSTDPAAPKAMPGNANVMWEHYDDQASCSGITHQWQYRVAGSGDPMTLITLVQEPMGPGAINGNYFQQWVWTAAVGTLGAGATYEFQAIVTDCAEQSVNSGSYYFRVGDADNDGILDAVDNCPDLWNPNQADSDGDGIGSWCDNCPSNCNTQQLDADNDEIGDVCDDPGDDGCLGCGNGQLCEVEC
jgi:hypothetical protein